MYFLNTNFTLTGVYSESTLRSLALGNLWSMNTTIVRGVAFQSVGTKGPFFSISKGFTEVAMTETVDSRNQKVNVAFSWGYRSRSFHLRG